MACDPCVNGARREGQPHGQRGLARHAGGDMLLAAPQHQVLRVLALTRLIDVFSVYPSVEEAVNSLRQAQA